jgi:hypothetical protein
MQIVHFWALPHAVRPPTSSSGLAVARSRSGPFQISRLKAGNAELTQRIARQDTELADLRQFKVLALSRLAAQHEEIHRLRAAASPPPGSNVRDLASRRAGT